MRISTSPILMIVAAFLLPLSAFAQNIPTVTATDTDRHIAFPAGAAAKLNTDTGDGAANALLGFQTWKEDTWFFSVFSSQAAEGKTISSQSEFGSFLLDPTSNGTSFYFSGNYTWKKGAFLFGPNARIGGSSTAWEATVSGTPQTVSGVVLYFSPAVQFSSHTFGKPDNSFQIGGEFGWGWRVLANDLGQASAFLAAPEVLGTAATNFNGFEGKLFFRANDLKPYMKVSNYMKPNGQAIPGLTGFQVSFGVEVLPAIYKK